MRRDLVLAVLWVVLVLEEGECELCPSMDIRNTPNELEKMRNCTVIMGHLHVVLLDVQEHSVYNQFVFPELVEIEDYLLVYNLKNLRSLGTIFPNLRVIRGRKLFVDYVLSIFKMTDIEEIGLTNLQYVGRGNIKIDHCPKLCFVETVDWEAIGAREVHYSRKNFTGLCKNKFCPDECHGYCWNTESCQKFPAQRKCHKQCNGCTKDDSPRHCVVCKFFQDGDECVESCPDSRVANYYSMKCTTREECQTMLKGTWIVFNNTCAPSCPPYYTKSDDPHVGCTFLGDKYQKNCSGTIVDDLATIESLKGCTHINGSLEIRISKTQPEWYLEENFGTILNISGYLKIGRSNGIKSLEFFKKLRVIQGKSLENQEYALFVFENPNLQRLWNFTGRVSLTIEKGTVAFHDNPQLCYHEIEELVNQTKLSNSSDIIAMSRSSNGDKSFCNPKARNVTLVERNPTNITMIWERLDSETDDTIVGYTIYYTPAFHGNVTAFEKNEACGVGTWNSVFVRTNRVELNSLSPYTRYGYYIKAYSTVSDGKETPVYYFNTSSDDPTSPVDLSAEAKTESTILLKWEPPRVLNGNLLHYVVTMYLQEDHLPFIEKRNYCQYPHTAPREETPQQERRKSNITDCPCLYKEDGNLFSGDRVCAGVGGDCKNFMYYSDSVDEIEELNIHNMQKRGLGDEMLSSDGHNFLQITQKGLDNTTLMVTNLKHFSVYIFYVMACNENEGTRELCSGREMISQRTNKSEKADIIERFDITVYNREAFVTWIEPKKVNSAIVSYNVEHKRVDLEHAKALSECITSRQFSKIARKYRISGLSPGKYAVRVRATSLAGPGQFSSWKQFEIQPPKTGLYWIYALVTIVAVLGIALAIYVARYWYRRKYALDSNHLITSINPDYAGPIYEEDEWEIDRSDIEIMRELGQGSFGMVCEGMIKSRRYPCAIKTVNDSATMPSRMEFLNEGSVMKSFNDGHHVIKLLGIVSRGQPPLVIMELMERGDLKSYLRRCREPSQNLTTNELYRMAAEIADGMAYLAAKKFVHRDLAARNCMVAADRTVKIGDFGMARDIYETDYYRKETVGLLPVRWMAPESLADGVFTSDSDVWSYGIVLWEMATLAEQPYQGLSNKEVLRFVVNKGKMERPPQCSELLFEVMDACWMWRPNDRPTFADIVDKLADHVGQDFRLVAFCYSRQGQDLALNAGPRVYNPPAMMLPPEEVFSHFDASEEEVSLCVKEPNRPTKFLPLSNQRYNKSSPHRLSPDSQSSAFSLNSS